MSPLIGARERKESHVQGRQWVWQNRWLCNLAFLEKIESRGVVILRMISHKNSNEKHSLYKCPASDLINSWIRLRGRQGHLGVG